MNRSLAFLTAAVVVLTLTLYGCTTGSTESTDAGSAAAGGQEGDAGGHAHAHGDGATDMDKMKAELAKLSPEDAASAEKQHMCPVSDEMLGAMGAPLKVDVNGQSGWICCEHCRDALLENPDKYLAKLNKDEAEQGH